MRFVPLFILLWSQGFFAQLKFCFLQNQKQSSIGFIMFSNLSNLSLYKYSYISSFPWKSNSIWSGLEKAMAPHSSTLAWRIPWMEEPGRLQSSDFTFTFHFYALEKEMATHSSVLAWRIPGMGEPGGLPSMGSHRVGHNWSNLAAAAAAGKFLSKTRLNFSL